MTEKVASPHDRRLDPISKRRLLSQDTGLVLVLLALAIGFSIYSPYFLTAANLSNVLLSVSVIGCMAAVSTLLIISRGLDLSLGSMVALCGMLTALTVEQWHWPWPLGIAVGLFVGALCGALNGVLIAGLRINSIIVTVGSLAVFRGLAYLIKDGQSLLVESSAILSLGSLRFFGLTVSVWIFAVVFAVVWFFSAHFKTGRSIYAMGASPKAAWISGLRVLQLRFGLFVASGVSAGLAGVLLIGQSGTAIPGSGMGYELMVITAVLLGGTSLHGGEGSVLRTLLGVLIIGVLNNGMVLTSVPSFYQIIANGALLLAAVVIDQIRNGAHKGPIES
jgi:ribose/xylose/arabinose/galactoside ABC-type transport system permease subunit